MKKFLAAIADWLFDVLVMRGVPILIAIAVGAIALTVLYLMGFAANQAPGEPAGTMVFTSDPGEGEIVKAGGICFSLDVTPSSEFRVQWDSDGWSKWETSQGPTPTPSADITIMAGQTHYCHLIQEAGEHRFTLETRAANGSITTTTRTFVVESD